MNYDGAKSRIAATLFLVALHACYAGSAVEGGAPEEERGDGGDGGPASRSVGSSSSSAASSSSPDVATMSSASASGSSSSGASTRGSTSSGSSSSGGSTSSSTSSSSGTTINFDTPVECTSGKKYTSGTGDTMEPGNSCASCHGSLFSIAGTVYPTAHESTNCDGLGGTGALVTITGADGNTLTIAPNSVGNFDTSRTVVMPLTAVVSFNGTTNAMTTPQITGDCNSCHTQSGANGAPGRIVLP